MMALTGQGLPGSSVLLYQIPGVQQLYATICELEQASLEHKVMQLPCMSRCFFWNL